MIRPHLIETDEPTTKLAWVTPAEPSDVERLMALPTEGNDNRSEPFWMRLHDGTLLLGIFPQGDTYMEFSDNGVCDWENVKDLHDGR